MTVYCARNGDTPVRRAVTYRGAGAGEIRCIECGGSGKWPFGYETTIPDCVDCKGTGRLLVSV